MSGSEQGAGGGTGHWCHCTQPVPPKAVPRALTSHRAHAHPALAPESHLTPSAPEPARFKPASPGRAGLRVLDSRNLASATCLSDSGGCQPCVTHTPWVGVGTGCPWMINLSPGKTSPRKGGGTAWLQDVAVGWIWSVQGMQPTLPRDTGAQEQGKSREGCQGRLIS